ncbi:MAG: ABC transporter substrate-binding protein [Propionibacteriaceae bacterium]|nr:ABC transporter substrate-binding protein [Propionibacteriaceae bacterium]
MFRRTMIMAAGLAVFATFSLAACSSNTPSSSGSGSDSKPTLVIGSQAYYSSDIIAEVYAQGLENAGYTVDRQFDIGQREVYLPEIQSGGIDVFPEYTGPLLQYWQPDATVTLDADVYSALQAAVPDGLRVLNEAPATDQDSYVVTQDFANKWGLTTIDDLSKVTDPMTMGANAEAQTRPNGPDGLLKTYGVSVGFTPIQDGGGPLTVKALQDNQIQLAIIYTSDPSIAADNLVTLTDDKGLFLSSHVVPLVSDKVDDTAAGILNKIDALLTPDALIAMNARSVNDQVPASTIAHDWLADNNLN